MQFFSKLKVSRGLSGKVDSFSLKTEASETTTPNLNIELKTESGIFPVKGSYEK